MVHIPSVGHRRQARRDRRNGNINILSVVITQPYDSAQQIAMSDLGFSTILK